MTNVKPMYVEDLEPNICPCGCNGMTLQAPCHPESKFLVSYSGEHHVVEMFCAKCGRQTVALKVAARGVPVVGVVQ